MTFSCSFPTLSCTFNGCYQIRVHRYWLSSVRLNHRKTDGKYKQIKAILNNEAVIGSKRLDRNFAIIAHRKIRLNSFNYEIECRENKKNEKKLWKDFHNSSLLLNLQGKTFAGLLDRAFPRILQQKAEEHPSGSRDFMSLHKRT